MVRIINYKERQKEDGTSFFVLEMPGSIIKEDCEPFEYVVKETGEEITLNRRWVYTTDDVVKPKQEQKVTASFNVFSQNGILEPAE